MKGLEGVTANIYDSQLESWYRGNIIKAILKQIQYYIIQLKVVKCFKTLKRTRINNEYNVNNNIIGTAEKL